MLEFLKSKIFREIPGEKVIFEIRPSYFILLAPELVISLIIVVLMLLFYFSGFTFFWIYLIVGATGIFIALVFFLNWYYTIFRMSNKRVENRIGVFGSREEEISLDDVQAVDVEQTFWGSILGFGTVLIKAAGEKREVDFVNISSPKRIANRIEDLALGGDAGVKESK